MLTSPIQFRILVYFLLLFPLSYSARVEARGGQEVASAIHTSGSLYQLLTADPHHLRTLLPHLVVVKQDGRLVLVKLKSPGAVPKFAFRFLRKVNKNIYRAKVNAIMSSVPTLGSSERMNLKLLSKTRFQENVRFLSRVDNRSAGSKGNANVTNWLFEYFERLGLKVQKFCYANNRCNVIAEKEGVITPKKAIVIQGHFDSVGAPEAGADDNASGTAGVLEMAHALIDFQSPHTLRFVLNNGEEQGLLGSKAYVDQLIKNDELKDVVFALNMDMIAYNSNKVVEIETDAPYESLAQYFAGVAKKYSSLTPKITIGAWGSDHVPYLKAGVPSLLTLEDWSTKTPCYHKACDGPESLNDDYAIEVLKMNTAAVMGFSQK